MLGCWGVGVLGCYGATVLSDVRIAFFHGKRRPAEMGAAEATQFLTALAVEQHVGATSLEDLPQSAVWRPAALQLLEKRWKEHRQATGCDLGGKPSTGGGQA